MDIDLLWSFGGWFLILFFETNNYYCMAKLRSSSQISQFSNPSSSLFCIALLIFIFLITLLQSSTSMAATSVPFEPTTSSRDEPSRTSTTTTMNFDHHPKRTTHHQSHSKSTRSFEAGAHEVPSGPNPISNR